METESESSSWDRTKLPLSIKGIVVLSTFFILLNIGSVLIAATGNQEVNWIGHLFLLLEVSPFIFVILLSLKRMRWGYAIGMAIAVLGCAAMISLSLWSLGRQEPMGTTVIAESGGMLFFRLIIAFSSLAFLYFCWRAFREHPLDHGRDAAIVAASLVIVLVYYAGLLLLGHDYYQIF